MFELRLAKQTPHCICPRFDILTKVLEEAANFGAGIPVIRQLSSVTESFSQARTGLSLDSTNDTAMQIRADIGSGGAWVTTDLNRTNNLGYVAGGTPVIRQLTGNSSSGTKVARINIRGRALANWVGWVSYIDIEPRVARTFAGNSEQGAVGGLKVVRAEIRGGSLANKVGWTLAAN